MSQVFLSGMFCQWKTLLFPVLRDFTVLWKATGGIESVEFSTEMEWWNGIHWPKPLISTSEMYIIGHHSVSIRSRIVGNMTNNTERQLI